MARYESNNSTFQIDANSEITNMNLVGASGALFEIAADTTTIGLGANYVDYIGVQIYINSGATLNDQSHNALIFTGNNNLTFTVLGTMDVAYGDGTGTPLIDRSGSVNDYIYVTDGGLLNYSGWSGITDTLRVPIRVEDGDFKVSLNANSPLAAAGKLVVQGAIARTNTVSVYVTGDGTSTVQLFTGMTLECDNDYYQDNGTLETMDSLGGTLQADRPSGGTVTIAGGTVKLYASGDGAYSYLIVNTDTLDFNGRLIVSIQGDNGRIGDALQVTGTTNLLSESSLYVNIIGQLKPMTSWTIIQDGQNNGISGDFTKPITTNPPANLTGEVNPKNVTQYILNS